MKLKRTWFVALSASGVVAFGAPRAALAQVTGSAESGDSQGAVRVPPPSDQAEQKARARQEVKSEEQRAAETERVREQRASAAPTLQPPADETPPADRPAAHAGNAQPIVPTEHKTVETPPAVHAPEKRHPRRRIAPPHPVQVRPKMRKPVDPPAHSAGLDATRPSP